MSKLNSCRGCLRETRIDWQIVLCELCNSVDADFSLESMQIIKYEKYYLTRNAHIPTVSRFMFCLMGVAIPDGAIFLYIIYILLYQLVSLQLARFQRVKYILWNGDSLFYMPMKIKLDSIFLRQEIPWRFILIGGLNRLSRLSCAN